MNKQPSGKFRLNMDLRQFIGNSLRMGVILSATVTAFGGIIYIFAHAWDGVPSYKVYEGELVKFRSIPGVLQGVASLDSSSIMQLGVLLLIATPIIRVLLSFIAFLAEGDYLYSIITLVVMGIITLSILS